MIKKLILIEKYLTTFNLLRNLKKGDNQYKETSRKNTV